ILYLDSLRPGRAFTGEEIQVAVTLARQGSMALERARLYESARQRAYEAETLRQATAAVAATLNQREAIERILEQLERVVPYDSASVQLLRDGYLEIVGGRGWPDPGNILGACFPVPGDNPNTLVIESRSPQVVNETGSTYASFKEPRHMHIRSWLGVPLIVHERVIGMLAVDSNHPGYFTSDHARLVAAFADQVAIAIENSRLYAEIEQRLNDLSRLYTAAQDLAASLDPHVVLEQLARHLTQALNATSGYILEADLENRTLKVLAEHFGPDANPAERNADPGSVYSLDEFPTALHAFENSEAISFSYDSPGITESEAHELVRYEAKTSLILPIIARGKLQGIAEIWESRRKRVFTQAEKRLAQALAQHAAGVIENARLFNTERMRARELDALRATLADISTELQLPKLQRAILERAVALMSATGGDLGILNEASRELDIVTSFNMGKDYAGVRMRKGEGAMGLVIETQQAVIIPDYQRWEGRSPQYAGATIHAAIAVPLLFGERLMGAIGINDASLNRQFTQSDLHLLTLFAQQAAVAIQNARLYEAAQDAAERRAILHKASQEIVASILDPEAIYTAVHLAASQVMPTEAFTISLYNESLQMIEAVYLVDR
ncbi:MAG: GAF domain-containing protein, partial [Chloroflexota bacterium]